MFRLILIIAAAIALMWLWKRYQAMTALQQQKMRWKLMAVVIGGGLLVLAISGRLNWIFAALAGLLATLPKLAQLATKFWPFLRGFLQMRASAAARHSKMQSAFLRLIMNRATGALSGEVLQGAFQGRPLTSLSQPECLQLLDECRHDAQSVSLLVVYLDATFPQWRQSYQGHAQQQSSQNDSLMSKQEAADILGVPLDADHKTIITAHKRLMQRLHPDRGGSNYLAVKINQAKDKLLA